MKNYELLETLRKAGVTYKNIKSRAPRLKIKGFDIERVKKLLVLEEENRRKVEKKAFNKAEAKNHRLSLKKYEALEAKGRELLNAFNSGHSMGCYRHLFLNGKLLSKNHILREYARSCKFGPTYGKVEIHLTTRELESLENISGVWTIRGNAFSCLALIGSGNKQTYNVGLKKMYLVGESHGENIREAFGFEKAKRAYRKAAEANKNKFVGIDHIKQAGACDAGINGFIQRHGINPDFGYKLEYLKELEPDNSFLRKL
jgi:hypothetical protein